ETLLLPEVREGYWGVADKGIYFLVGVLADVGNPATDRSAETVALKFYDFGTMAVSAVPGPPALRQNVRNGFSVSRDGKFVIWTQLDNAIKDLMMIAPWKP